MNLNKCCSKKDKENLDKWTSSINTAFVNGGKEMFKDFLLSRGLDEAFLTVTFWEKCDTLQKEIKHRNDTFSSKTNILNALREIVSFADENVNFYENEMEVLEKMLVDKDISNIFNTLEKAKKCSLNLLNDEHKLFSENLIKEFNKRSCC